jgi:phosphoglycolate phosphatase-like HAD superfamily hydrolase
MTIKHEKCFGPAFVRVFELAPEQKVLEEWNRINLYSQTRGINRFLGFSFMLEKYGIDGAKDFEQWTKESGELSNRALEARLESEVHNIFAKAYYWSNLVNELIDKLPIAKPFNGVKLALSEIRKKADIAVVSSANPSAVYIEWEQGGLREYVSTIMTQNDGSKSECLSQLCKCGYAAEDILMVGDSPGDYMAAKHNGSAFYPILVNNEAYSWEQLRGYVFPMFYAGEYIDRVQQHFIEIFEKKLEGALSITGHL